MLRRLSEYHRSTWECIISLTFVLGPFLGNLVHCAYQVSIGNGLLQYRLGFIEVPKYLGAGASYQDVLILNVCAVLALLIGIALRYYHYRHERDFIRKHKIEGETGFKSIFSPSKSSGSGSSYNNIESIDGD